jgi:predicted RNase H-like nuclease (RuvC/YqgF family)
MSGALVPILAAVIAALAVYIEASRRLSGKINTSEAKSLWDESASIRKDYADRLAKSEERMAHQDERIGKLEERNNELARENLELKARNNELQARCDDLLRQLETFQSENESLKRTIRRFLPDE